MMFLITLSFPSFSLYFGREAVVGGALGTAPFIVYKKNVHLWVALAAARL